MVPTSYALRPCILGGPSLGGAPMQGCGGSEHQCPWEPPCWHISGDLDGRSSTASLISSHPRHVNKVLTRAQKGSAHLQPDRKTARPWLVRDSSPMQPNLKGRPVGMLILAGKLILRQPQSMHRQDQRKLCCFVKGTAPSLLGRSSKRGRAV